MATNAGILFVTMAPRPSLPLPQFHDWYNNEHGPTRLRLPHIFANGFRFEAVDGPGEGKPPYAAVYDVPNMSHLTSKSYTDLRVNRSPREAATIGQVDVDRRFYDLIMEKKTPLWMPIERLTDREAHGIVLVAARVMLNTDNLKAAEELESWYREEHMELLSKVPGWLRTRLFKKSTVSSADEPETHLALHEFQKDNGIGGEEFTAAITTERTKSMDGRVVSHLDVRQFRLFYVFGPAPRDLCSLADLGATKESPYAAQATSFSYSPSTSTTTFPVPLANPAIESYAPSALRGPHPPVAIPYRLEAFIGSLGPSALADGTAPTIAFCNSLLTSFGMWDPLLPFLRAAFPATGVRLLRFDHRGRRPGVPPQPVTIDALASDLAALLEALRIDSVDVVVGVSMGGATCLRFACVYPEKLARWVACDFNVASSEANTRLWKERIAVAEGPGEGGQSGIRALAAQTVKRWFHPNVIRDRPGVARTMEDMVATNDVEGFRWGCQALWNYDLRRGYGGTAAATTPTSSSAARESEGSNSAGANTTDEKTAMRNCTVPGLLVVGEGDGGGKLVEAMKGFRGEIGPEGTVQLRIVPGAGHLPMYEQPDGFWAAAGAFIVGDKAGAA